MSLALARLGFTALLALILLPQPVRAQDAGEPKPINAPAIPPLPHLKPAPKLNQAAPGAAPRVEIDVPAPAKLGAVTPPPPRPMTPADKNDPAPALADTPPPLVSPGASAATIQQVVFTLAPGAADLPAGADAKLATVATALAEDTGARVEIRAFTPQAAPSDNKARRLSLSRVLSVREALMKRGVADNRIDSRALASQPGEVNADRIELYIERTR